MRRNAICLRLSAVLALFFLVLACGEARAVTCGAIPFSFANGTIWDATQVNTNFAALRTCVNNVATSFAALRDSAGLNPTPGNFYVSATGSDAADCLTSVVSGAHGPCLTINHTLAVALATDARQALLTINIGAGTFTEPVAVNGPNVGGTSATNFVTAAASMPVVLLKGAGSGSTTIFGPATYLGNNYCYAILANGGANVGLQALSVQANGGGGSCNVSDLYVQAASMWIFSDVVLKAATGNLISMEENALLYVTAGTSAPGLTLAGNAYNGISIDGNSTFVSDSTVQISGAITLSGSCFLDVSYHSVFKISLPNPAFTSGATVTGRRFCLDGLSDLLIGSPPAVWPGSFLGLVANGSRYQAPSGPVGGGAGACIGGAAGCPNANGPTGLGTGSTAMSSGSGAYGGAVALTAGVGAAASGSVSIWLPYEMDRGVCSPSFQGTGTWNARASVVTSGFTTSNGIILTWDNNAAALTAGLTYYIGYTCNTTQ